MIEIFRKGFRLDIPPDQVVTFKKSQNLNGVQDRYAYSNTVSVDKTANIRKLLELTDLPSGKTGSLKDGFQVDIVLNGSIQLRNQTLKIQKESKDKVDLYLLYTDSSLIVKLKEQYLNSVTENFKNKKSALDIAENLFNLNSPAVFVETQPDSGLYVIEEMPRPIKLTTVIRKLFESNGYTVYGDFFDTSKEYDAYYITPNKGIYQIYPGSGEGFAPSFDPDLTLYGFLTQTLQTFNCYAEPDDTYKTVIVNSWSNLGDYKNNYVDYSSYFVDYQDYSFQSKLARKNELKYADSDTTFNSYFSNSLSSEKTATYLDSGFGSGSTLLFDNSEIKEDGTIELRPNGFEGEISAVRLYKISNDATSQGLYIGGVKNNISLRRAISVSMREIYTAFHKDYTDFILTPLISNLWFRYDGIMAADFSMVKVFFTEQLNAYWIPLEINFSTKKDKLIVKAMLVKKRKVVSPVLNNLNSILLDFKEKAVIPTATLLAMYPMPPNEYPWTEIVFNSYDQNLNRLYVDGVLIPANSLPQVFDVNSEIAIEANKPSDITPDKNSASFYVQAIDSNGGVSNEAYITIKHTGVAKLESNFRQPGAYIYERNGFNEGHEYANVMTYFVGNRPNLNDTITSVAVITNNDGPNNTFNLIEAVEDYDVVDFRVSAFQITLRSVNGGAATSKSVARLKLYNGTTATTVKEFSLSGINTKEQTFNSDAFQVSIMSLATGKKARLYWDFTFNKSGFGLQNVKVTINNMEVSISTTKII